MAYHRRHLTTLLAPVFILACQDTYPADADHPTNCGMFMTVSAEEHISIHALQLAEDAALFSFARHVSGWSRDLTCPRLDGYLLSVGPAASWVDPEYGPIAGKTVCATRMLEINLAPFSQSSYQHELAHAIQNCQPPGHINWLDAGIYDAIDDARDHVP